MRWWNEVKFISRKLNRNRADKELDEEIRTHIESETQDKIDAGLSPQKAHEAARRQFGNQMFIREASREVWGFQSIERLRQDLQFGIRMFQNSPGLTAALILTIALGIGLNTALFSVVNTLLLNPLPFPNAERLVLVWTRSAKISGSRLGVTPEDFVEWRKQTQAFSEIAAATGALFNLSGTDEPERIPAARVSTNFFSLLGIKPALGRDFLPEEDDPKSGGVVILNQGVWRRRFNADPNLVGGTIKLNNLPYTVVGILPSDFRFPQIHATVPEQEIWTPLQAASLPERGAPFLTVLGRLKAGFARDAAQSELNLFLQRRESARTQPDTGRGVTLVPLQEEVVGKVRLSLFVLFGAVGVVLLIACANVSNLLMARAAARKKEMALRLAIGASRFRLIRQLLTEGLLLAAVGGAFGYWIAHFSLPLLLSLSQESIPLADAVAIDGRVLFFTIALSILIGLAFSLLPAIQASAVNPNQFLKEGGKSGTAGRSGLRFRGLLIVFQAALALVLTISAGLLTRSFLALLNVDPGFNPKKVLTFDLFLSPGKTGSPQGARFYQQLIANLGAIPGVEAAGAVNTLPLGGGDFTWTFFIEGRQPAERPVGRADFRIITPDFFRTIGVPLKQGRLFTEQDTKETTPVGLINEAMARLYWPNENPIGKRFRVEAPISISPWATVIGVVGDVKHYGLDQAVSPAMYRPHQQQPRTDMTVVVRTQADPLALAASVRNQIRSMERDLPISNLREYTEYVSKSLAQRRFAMALLGFFAATALALSLFGVYGVLSYSVGQRTHELAIRQALGAQSRDMMSMIVRQGMSYVFVGMLIGLATALGVTRILATMLYEVKPFDLTTYMLVVFLITGVAALACYLPARRASKVDPMIALRSQ